MHVRTFVVMAAAWLGSHGKLRGEQRRRSTAIIGSLLDSRAAGVLQALLGLVFCWFSTHPGALQWIGAGLVIV